MASNPMKRQARNSFLLGMVLTFVITGAVIGLLFKQLTDKNKQLQEELDSSINVMVLSHDVKSGDIITADMFQSAKAKQSSVPINYVDISTVLDAYSLYTKDGVRILTRYEDGVQNLYLDDNANQNQQTQVKVDPETGKYYTGSDSAKNFIETVEAPVIAKVDIPQNTIVTQSMIGRSDEIDTNDVRLQEYNSFVLPVDLMTDDYVDVRFMLPTGEDFIVASKKRVTIPVINGVYSADTVQMKLSEDEILSVSSALIEAYRMDGSKLYLTKYTEAGLQEKSTPTYVVSKGVVDLMNANPNIVNEAKTALNERYTQALKDTRNNEINAALDKYGDDAGVSSNLEKSTTASQEARQEYLQSLVPEAQ